MDNLRVLRTSQRAVTAQNAAVFDDFGLMTLEINGFHRTFAKAFVAIFASRIAKLKKFRHNDGVLEFNQGIDFLHEKFFGIIFGDVVQKQEAIFGADAGFLHHFFRNAVGLHVHALGAMAEAETGLQFDEVFNVIFLEDVFQGLDHIVGTFQVARTAHTYFDIHFGLVLRVVCYERYFLLFVVLLPCHFWRAAVFLWPPACQWLYQLKN
jgi:hypothetical protein